MLIKSEGLRKELFNSAGRLSFCSINIAA